MSGIRLQRKFTEKMAIHDHYITGLNNRHRKGKDEPMRRLFDTIRYDTTLFNYAGHTQQKLVSRWGVGKHVRKVMYVWMY